MAHDADDVLSVLLLAKWGNLRCKRRGHAARHRAAVRDGRGSRAGIADHGKALCRRALSHAPTRSRGSSDRDGRLLRQQQRRRSRGRALEPAESPSARSSRRCGSTASSSRSSMAAAARLAAPEAGSTRRCSRPLLGAIDGSVANDRAGRNRQREVRLAGHRDA